jgi:hypothetical protein
VNFPQLHSEVTIASPEIESTIDIDATRLNLDMTIEGQQMSVVLNPPGLSQKVGNFGLKK